ncbi:WD repeat-containing protein 41-like [Bombina bombina]|uniref:WD repeat-containing protein 41-like n=1 Tax=Bombina bombina TaxID=8345 RepID=UPI00235AE66D|nr:WD repeat-containing protein 41-like [Bombina bombina]
MININYWNLPTRNRYEPLRQRKKIETERTPDETPNESGTSGDFLGIDRRPNTRFKGEKETEELEEENLEREKRKRFASACDDGSVYIWDVKTGEVLFELQGHKQKITAVVVFKTSEHFEERIDFILTASADKTVIAWNCETGQQIQTATDFQSPVKTLTVLQRLDVWLSGGGELRVWNREFKLLCETGYFMDRGISALIELPKNCVAAAVGKDLSISQPKSDH